MLVAKLKNIENLKYNSSILNLPDSLKDWNKIQAISNFDICLLIDEELHWFDMRMFTIKEN